MTTINLYTNDQLLSFATKTTIASGGQKTVLLHVDFDAEWDGYEKSAVFFTSNDETVYEMIMTDGECIIPHEALSESGTLFIGVRGVNSDNNQVKTSSLVKQKIFEGAPIGDATSVEPTPDVYQQFVAKMQPHIGKNGNWYVGNTDTGKPSLVVLTEKYQYVKKDQITDGYFWYFDSNVTEPYKYKYADYSTIEPIVLPAGTYCFSPLMIAYSWVKVGINPVEQIDSYDATANISTPFALTFPEETTVWLGYHNPQITASTPYVLVGNEPLSVEYFEGVYKYTLGDLFKLENIGGEEAGKYQYVKKDQITDGYFWYFDSNVTEPYKYKYADYSTIEPIVLPAGTYCFSPLMIAYSWVKVGINPVEQIDSYDATANISTPFALTFPEETTVWLGYHNPQITAVTPYLVSGDQPLKTGEYWEGEEKLDNGIYEYGVFVEAYIKNCELIANELTGGNIGDAKGHYTGVKMDANITRLMCKAKFFPNASVALITTDIGSRMVTDITFGSVHLVYGLTGCAVGVFDTKDKLRSIDYFSYTITAGEELAFGFDINESTNTLTVYLPDGTTKTATDTAISTFNGKYAIWEHFCNTSEGEFASCKITKLYCEDASGEVLEDNLQRFDGAVGVAPTGQVYRQFTSHNSNNRDFK